MDKTYFSAKGFLGADSEQYDAVKLNFKEKNGFGAVYVKADAGEKYFNADLAVAIRIEQPAETESFV